MILLCSHILAANPNSETPEIQSQEKFTVAFSKGHYSSRRLKTDRGISHANSLLDLCCLKSKLHPSCMHRGDLGNAVLLGLVTGRFLLSFHILLKIVKFLCNVRNL